MAATEKKALGKGREHRERNAIYDTVDAGHCTCRRRFFLYLISIGYISRARKGIGKEFLGI